MLIQGAAVRTVLRWQVVATTLIAVIGWWWEGRDAALSGALGGFINMLGGLAYYAVARLFRADTAGATIRVLLRAEAMKIAVTVGGLAIALSTYQAIVAVPFIAAFIVTALLPATALLAADKTSKPTASR
jgi:F0F1-type ATP synthase assembly protein I